MKLAVRCQKLVSVPFWEFEMAGICQRPSLKEVSKAFWYKCIWVPLHPNRTRQLELLNSFPLEGY